MSILGRSASAVALALLGSVLLAQTAPAELPFEDAVLVSFKTVESGEDCSSNGTTKGTVSDQGDVNGTVSSTTYCSSTETRVYVVRVGSSQLTLEPTISGKRAAGDAALAIGTLGYGALFLRHKQALANQLPGTHILIRAHGSDFEVRVGSRTSLYRLVGAQ